MTLTQEVTTSNTNWRNRSKCLHVKDPNIFFLKWTVEEAKAICAGCPVKVQCLEYAQSRDAFGFLLGGHGVWAGLSEAERKALREKERQRRRYALFR